MATNLTVVVVQVCGGEGRGRGCRGGGGGPGGVVWLWWWYRAACGRRCGVTIMQEDQRFWFQMSRRVIAACPFKSVTPQCIPELLEILFQLLPFAFVVGIEVTSCLLHSFRVQSDSWSVLFLTYGELVIFPIRHCILVQFASSRSRCCSSWHIHWSHCALTCNH